MKFNIKNKETKSFKKRYCLGFKKPKMLFGDYSLSFFKSYNIEYIYLYNFKKSLKKYYNFKKDKLKKVWLFLHKNYPLTKKSKNARMGKGKGSLARYCSRVLQNHNIMEFLGFSYREIMTLRKIFFKKVKIPVKIYSNFFLEKHHFVCGKLESNMNIKKYKK